MARSQVSIVNRAIDMIGGLAITSLNDNTKSARAMKRAYTPVLEDLQTKHDWTFAKTRVELAVSTEEPLYEYSTAFQLPADYSRILEVYPKYTKYSIEGDKLLANATELKMKYVRKVEDPNEFSPEFAEVFSKALAAECCYSITQSRALADDKKKEFKEYWQWAVSNDSKKSGTAEEPVNDVWMVNRGYGTDPNQDARVLEDFDYGSVS